MKIQSRSTNHSNVQINKVVGDANKEVVQKYSRPKASMGVVNMAPAVKKHLQKYAK